MQYGQSQWLLFFFTYSVLGWIRESLYVSTKEHQWINRGFLYGPWLPIYGFGAIIILFLTLPVRKNLIWIFLLGMTGATVLEYVTGDVMERLFHVRYWDYSKQPLNVNGHICLGVSLAWGVFSILLVHFLHSPVEQRLRQTIEQFEQSSDAFRLKIQLLEENAAHNQEQRKQIRELKRESRSDYLIYLLNQRRMAKSRLLSIKQK